MERFIVVTCSLVPAHLLFRFLGICHMVSRTLAVSAVHMCVQNIFASLHKRNLTKTNQAQAKQICKMSSSSNRSSNQQSKSKTLLIFFYGLRRDAADRTGRVVVVMWKNSRWVQRPQELANHFCCPLFFAFFMISSSPQNSVDLFYDFSESGLLSVCVRVQINISLWKSLIFTVIIQDSRGLIEDQQLS